MLFNNCFVYDSWMHPLCDCIRKIVDLEKESAECMEALIDNFLELQTTDKRCEISGNLESFGSFLVDRMPVSGIRYCTNLHVRKAVEYLHTHLSETYSLTRLSDFVGMSPAALCRLFRAETMQTTREYLRNLRMRKAKELLETTALMVVEVAEIAGYSCTTHFINDFKAFSGYTPQSYRLVSRKRGSL